MSFNVDHFIKVFRGKKVAVSYSGGFDSSILAWHLRATADAAEVLLLNFDCGFENDPVEDPEYYLAHKPRDAVKDIWQYMLYGSFLMEEERRRFNTTRIKMVTVPTVPLNGLTVEPTNLKPDGRAVTDDMEQGGVEFYAGFVMLRLTAALSIAAARGYDYVVTGHMGWNTHYHDESDEYAGSVNRVFAEGYAGRLKTVPRVIMPFRRNGLTKPDLIKFNADHAFSYDPGLTVSCAPGVVDTHDDPPRYFKTQPYGRYDIQLHCGKCTHCLDRKASFKAAGVEDTAYYAP